MKLLLLGGTADARRMADQLHQAGISVVYSIAGLVRVPKVDCQLLVGGFSQFGGLAKYLQEQHIDAILDITHPYAATMSTTAVVAAKALAIPCWRLHRPAWRKQPEDCWFEYQDDEQLLGYLSQYRRPLLSAGQMSQALLTQIAALDKIETLLWRTAVPPKFELPKGVAWQKAIGPFSYQDEQSLLEHHQIDVIVSKNSGGDATYAKLDVARTKNIHCLLHKRPHLPSADRQFSDAQACYLACVEAWGNTSSTNTSAGEQ